ncbi:hypothetical protein AGA25_19780 [Escherichia coli]|nr:hypothetical protein AGA25_19780 [Escherichia coli]
MTFQNHTDCPLTDFGGKTSIFSHPVYLFLRKFSLQDSRGGSRRRFPRQPHWTHEFTHNCVEKVKSLFPHLRAESGGFLPLKIGITNDFAAFLTEHPETELTLDEWSCAISCITTRQVYLLRTAVAGIPRYGLDGLPAGQVSECDAQNARRWLAVREKQKLKMKTMQEQTASTEKIER